MKSSFASAFLLSVVCAIDAQAGVNYATISDTNAIVTGIRSDSSTSDSVVLTANYSVDGIMYAGLYEGSLAGSTTAPSSSWHLLTPVFPMQTVTAATFYGPNTFLFDPSLGAGNVCAVGSYKYAQGASGPNFDHGLLYVGPLNGTGTWTQIDATPLVLRPRETLLDTIAHSTMGKLVVGNYDTNLATGNAFIYDKVTHTWTNLNPGGTKSVTAYGIWQNGGSSSTSYTIAGGLSEVNSGGLDKSYLVDYDSVTHALTNFRTYQYQNLTTSAALCHFDGITATATGFNLTGIVTIGGTLQGFFASVPVNANGSFGEATWAPIFYPGSKITTGNTIVDNKVLGIFINGGTQSYIATVFPDGVAVNVKKTGSRAVFTITNTGGGASNYRLSRLTRVANDAPNPGPVKPGKSSPVKITYSLGGANITKALEGGTATTGSIPPGGIAQLVENVTARRPLAYRRTIRTTLQAVSAGDPSSAASAKVELVLKAQ